MNRSEKSDRDAAEWMPARHGAWFAERVIQVTLEYGLRVDPFLENPAPPSPVHAGDGLVGQEARATVAAELLHDSPALGAQTHRRSFKMTKMAKMINMPRSNTRECSSLSGLSGALGDGRSATRRPACSRRTCATWRPIKRRVTAKEGFREFPAARRTIQGYEAMHMIRKGQARRLNGSDVRQQIQFINKLFEVAA